MFYIEIPKLYGEGDDKIYLDDLGDIQAEPHLLKEYQESQSIYDTWEARESKYINYGVPSIKVKLNTSQLKEIERLWFIFGNSGKFSTSANHKYVQQLVTYQQDHRRFYKPNKQCLTAIGKVIGAHGQS